MGIKLHTLCTEVDPALIFADTFEPTGFDTIEATFSFYKILAAQVYWAVTIPKRYSSPFPEQDDEYEEQKNKEKESR